ncbi:MAG TPA: molybdopterin cofactor-binding domain-containing protein, partial [Gammaproteobacteria bacterium]|nr:molybdopterin cofactor-binding domain-containing protein [Gammaproteobacteria bacterium]
MSTRREFLKTSAAAGGGLMIALQIPGCAQKPGESALANPSAPVQAGAWLRIGTDGSITFLSDKSEMGQGVYTSLTTLVAEELDVPVESLRFEAAPPGDVYVNTLLGAQVTGGSTSVREGWEKLRRTAAEARARLVQAAAQHWGVDAAQLRADNGAIVRGDGSRLTYGQLATAAAALPAPANVTPKSASAFSQVGKPRRRLDTPLKVNGTAAYGIDQRFPNMLFGALAQSPVLGGSVRSFEDSRARTMPGVRQVVQTKSGIVVLADSWWQARQARDALEIQWDPGPNATLSNKTISAGLAEALEKRSAEAKVARNDGDADAALAGAPRKVEAIYELPLLAHATLEPQNCTVVLEGDEIHLHVPTQVQQLAQAAAAQAAGVPVEKVFVHTTYLGGGFGRRLEVDFVPAAVEAARAANRPVKLLWTREDDTTHDYYRPPYRHRCTAALKPDGALAAWKLEICGPSVTSRWAPAAVANQIDPFVLEAAANYPYDADNVRVSFLQHEIGINVGYLRSVSHATNCFAAESFMDELAYAAGKDPYEFRRGLLERQKESRWRAVLERAAARARWGKAESGRFQGIALMEGYGSFLALVAEISLDGGKVRTHRISGAVDVGRMVNPSIVDAQIRSGIIFGLSAALWGDITIENGVVQQKTFDTYRLVRMNEA